MINFIFTEGTEILGSICTILLQNYMQELKPKVVLMKWFSDRFGINTFHLLALFSFSVLYTRIRMLNQRNTTFED